MMSNEQHLLLKLIEECAEVQQRASKYMQFGGQETQTGHIDDNTTRLVMEINDLICTIALLSEENILPTPNADDLRAWYERKVEKIEKYRRYSQELGYVEGARNA